jgi:hypothetical protein
VSVLPRRDAHRRVHHLDVGDRPDPRAPPDPRRARAPRRCAEPPIDAGPRDPRGVTFATSVGRRSAGHLSTARRPATTRGSSVWAAVPPARRMGPRRHRSPHSDRRSHGPRGARTRQRARRHPPVGARAAGDRALYSTDSRPAPIEIPIPRAHGPRPGREPARVRGRLSCSLSLDSVEDLRYPLTSRLRTRGPLGNRTFRTNGDRLDPIKLRAQRPNCWSGHPGRRGLIAVRGRSRTKHRLRVSETASLLRPRRGAWPTHRTPHG